MNTRFKTPITDEQRDQLGRVGVLYGGLSAEREVSLQSGQAVLRALQTSNVNVIGIDVQENAIQAIERANLSRAFIALHGTGGEDGQIQALLNFMKIPFTGSDVQGSAIAMDKLKCKQIWQSLSLSTPTWLTLDDNSNFDEAIVYLGGKAFIKPSHEGSSIGMARVESAAAMEKAYWEAKRYDTCVIAEQLIDGPEYTVSIVGDQVLPSIRMETDNAFYDYEAKYISNETRYFCPSGLNADIEARLRQLAYQAYRAIGCSGWGRVDVMSDTENNFYLLEVNTIPGMTSHSLVPMAAKAVGWSFEQLVLNILMSGKAGDA
jgi:D-alanine-D-alanine ligase